MVQKWEFRGGIFASSVRVTHTFIFPLILSFPPKLSVELNFVRKVMDNFPQYNSGRDRSLVECKNNKATLNLKFEEFEIPQELQFPVLNASPLNR